MRLGCPTLAQTLPACREVARRLFGMSPRLGRGMGRPGGSATTRMVAFLLPDGYGCHSGRESDDLFFGSLWVSDPGNRRYTVFGTDGRIRTHRRAARIGVGPWPARFTENGDFCDVSVERQWSREQRGPPSTVYAFEHVSAHGEVLDTVMLIRWPVRLDREGMNAIMDFAPRFVFAIDPTGAVWVANTKDYAVYRTLLPGGDTTLVFTLDSHAARVSEAERDSVVAQGWVESGDLPEYKPIIDRVFASSRYVFIIPMLEGYRPGSVIDVFTTDGVFVGRLESPVTIDWRSTDFALGDHIYVGTLDELGVHQVSRLRIVQ